VPFDQATFEYDEKFLMDPPFRKSIGAGWRILPAAVFLKHL
jgi:hypothetical protein